MSESVTRHYDVLIIGAGGAGLTLALNLPSRLSIAVLAKEGATVCSTHWAQGGVAGVIADEDDFQSHIADTHIAGAGLCDEDSVKFTIENSTQSIRWLEKLGVPFTRDIQTHELHLTREGGHSHRRIVHAADATGRAMHATLLSEMQKRDNIDFFEHHTALDLILDRERPHRPCFGAFVLDERRKTIDNVLAKKTVLATGGASKVYLYTSNPDTSTGDGIAMAWRAGANIANMEFTQFHPTCLYDPRARTLLLTEALRGEGAHLLLPDGTRFMQHHDNRAELAPRDVVARAIDFEIKKLGIDSVFLDISHRGASFVKTHFPNAVKRCKQYGYDLTSEPVPVVPAAHYTCGGVMVDLNAKTNVQNLYAIGEVSYTGLHGANRLASNSLLECLVFGKACAEDISESISESEEPPHFPQWDDSRVEPPRETVLLAHDWHEVRSIMSDFVGIVRSEKRLKRASRRLQLLQQEIQEYYYDHFITKPLIELRNLATVAEIIIRSAQKRKESIGLHYTLDYPTPKKKRKHRETILSKKEPIKSESSRTHLKS